MSDDSIAQAGSEPVAFVPVHPRQGPLWSDTFPAGSDLQRSENYPRMPLYAAPPQAALIWPDPKVTNPDIAQPTGVPYINCLIHRLLDAQQDINVESNYRMSQPLCDASALIDEVETALRALAAVGHAKHD